MSLLAVSVLNTVLLLGCAGTYTAQRAKTQTYEQSRTELMRAAERGDLRSVRALIREGAEVNAGDISGGTALMSAAANGHLAVVKALLAAGANPNARGATLHYGDFSVLMTAMQPRNQEWLRIVDALIAAGAEVNPTAGTRFPLAYAVEVKSGEMADAMLARGADINHKTPAGHTALMMAAVGGDAEMVRYLIGNGADVRAQTRDGETALSLVRQMAKEDGGAEMDRIERLLKEAGADQ